MNNTKGRNGLYWFTVAYLLVSISFSRATEPVKVVSAQPRRLCLQYSISSTNASELYNLEDEDATEIAMCEQFDRMCYILWKRDIKGGKILVTVLRRGCWRYENNERESCNTTNCVLSQHSFGNIHFCCCQTDLCNSNFRTKHAFPTAKQQIPTKSTGTKYKHLTQINVLFLAGVILVGAFLLLLTCIVTCRTFFRKRRKITNKTRHSTIISRGHPLLTERPKFISRIHVGKRSEVWYGRVKSKAVAIKKFRSSSYGSWKQERDIYKVGLNHPGILKIFGEYILEKTWDLNYIILTEYHPRGSLRHVLESNIISWQTMCTMSKSTALALAYLHGEQEKTHFSCIVHRNLKSENILVKADDSCVLCDFGLARVKPMEQRSVAGHNYKQVSTPRYMASEMLEGRINLNDITTQLKQIDIYALGTVLWEISSRCADVCSGLEIPIYNLPQLDSSDNTTNGNVKSVIVKQHLTFSDTWNIKSQCVKELKELICQCLDEDPEARLSASCVCHSINQLQENYKTQTDLI